MASAAAANDGATAPAPPADAAAQQPTASPAAKKGADKPTQAALVLAAMRPPGAARAPLLVDVGANIADAAYHADRPDVLRRARRAGVAALVVTGCSLEGSRAAAALCDAYNGSAEARAGEYPLLRFTAGVHPHHAKDCVDGETIGALRALAAHPCCAAIGECGLDFCRDLSPRDAQERWFGLQVRLAIELGKPLFMHCRDAGERFAAVLNEAAAEAEAAAGGARAAGSGNGDSGGTPELPVPGVLHCFTGNAQELRECLDLGLHIGITGWVCDERPERGGAELAALLPTIPRDRLMIETDAPYLTPRTILPSKARPHRNEPALLPYVLETVAGALGEEQEAVARRTSAMAAAFFGIAPQDIGLVPETEGDGQLGGVGGGSE